MNVIQSDNKFRRVTDIKIPEIYFRRFTTGAEDFDAIFGGEGFLPGMSFTLAAAPGSGKCHGPNEKIRVFGDQTTISRVNAFLHSKARQSK